MSEEKKKSITSIFDMVSKIQRVLFYVILFIIPWFVIPLPNDTTEKIKSILFIVLSSLLILLEIVKWVWDGKITVVKSPLDKVFILLFGSFLLASIFAPDRWMSFWGYDGRMGTSLFPMIFLFVFFFLSRGFMQKKEEVVNAASALSIGLFVLILVSMLSMLKVEVFGWLPYVKEFYVVGLPLTFYFQEVMLLCGVSIFLNIFVLIDALRREKYQSILFPIVGLAISFISLPIFSTSQGITLPLLFFVVAIFVCSLLWIKLEKGLKPIPIIVGIFALLSVGLSFGLQYDSFTKSVLGDSFNVIKPVLINSDTSWKIASSAIVGDFFRGLVGVGNDSFGVAYNLYRPASQEAIVLGNTTFVTGSSELFTTLSNRGLIGVTAWLLLGFAYLRLVIKQVSTAKGERGTTSILLGLTSLFIFLGSAFLPFSFLTFFVLFTSTILLVVFDNREDSNDEFLLKFWAVNTGSGSKDINKTMESINWSITILVSVLTVTGIVFMFVKAVSSAYAVRADAYTVEINRKYQGEEEVSMEVKEDYLERIAGYYDRALRYDPKNPYLNRKAGLIILDMINLLAERHKEAAEEDKEEILSRIKLLRNNPVKYTENAVDTSNLLYANWNTRASIFMGLIDVGFTEYTEDALQALSTCVTINPLDYDAYYKMGMVYITKGEYDKALSSFNSTLLINQQHVPSLILSASLLYEMKDVENAVAYLSTAKEILEVNKLEESDIYQNIVKSLETLGIDETQVEEIEEIEETVSEQEEATPVEEDTTVNDQQEVEQE